VIDSFSGVTTKSIGVLDPIPGNWSIMLLSTTGLGAIQLRAFVDAPRPVIKITSLASDVGSSVVSVSYDTTAIHPDATLSLLYVDDRSLNNAVLIGSSLPTLNGHGSFAWDTSNVPSCAYYLYAMLDDGTNGLAFGFSPRLVPVRVQASAFPSPSVQAV
jgi:hypothetical protein